MKTALVMTEKDIAAKTKKQRVRKQVIGPSLYEMAYLKQLQEELSIFLRNKGFSTINEIQVGFCGADYSGQMRVARTT